MHKTLVTHADHTQLCTYMCKPAHISTQIIWKLTCNQSHIPACLYILHLTSKHTWASMHTHSCNKHIYIVHMSKLETMHACMHIYTICHPLSNHIHKCIYTGTHMHNKYIHISTHAQRNMHTPKHTHICTYSHRVHKNIHTYTHSQTCQTDNTNHHSTKDKPQLRALFTETTPSLVLGCT